ncbi:30S ribosomal protein S19 [Candidatus Woesearchaeota archaeon]|jgi:small subunit ribosomal protein S19|nr:30S ribosomal protein S19 [Candidatus Woesearchaeota archaeon]MBT6023277.1 30S ribosomal protein S19 [Candidatus Woesearchaeota archaeon]
MVEKVFKFKGKTMEELLELDRNQFAELLSSRKRRTIKRGISENQEKFMEKLAKGKPKLRTHRRDIIITPAMVGKTVEVYNGKKFITIIINEEMLGYYLGSLVQTRKIASHKGTGVGATKSSKHQGKK